MTASKEMFVRHVQTGEIKQVTPEQRETQDKNYWVRITGADVQATAPAAAPADTDAAEADQKPAPKTTSKATTPAK